MYSIQIITLAPAALGEVSQVQMRQSRQCIGQQGHAWPSVSLWPGLVTNEYLNLNITFARERLLLRQHCPHGDGKRIRVLPTDAAVVPLRRLSNVCK